MKALPPAARSFCFAFLVDSVGDGAGSADNHNAKEMAIGATVTRLMLIEERNIPL